MNKFKARNRRKVKSRSIINQSERARLTVFRSGLHIYAQIILPGQDGDMVLVSASTLDKELKSNLTGNKSEQACQVGKLIAKRAQENNLIDVAFDRAGYKYHGRVKALAQGAREAGLNF
jgi:large subunit ribosomal protein L18